MDTGTFLTISMSPPMLSSLSLSRSIAVWNVNFQVPGSFCKCHNAAHPSRFGSYLDQALPICEASFASPQSGENPRNILYSPQLTMHYVHDVEVFGARETLYGIVTGFYDLERE